MNTAYIFIFAHFEKVFMTSSSNDHDSNSVTSMEIYEHGNMRALFISTYLLVHVAMEPRGSLL